MQNSHNELQQNDLILQLQVYIINFQKQFPHLFRIINNFINIVLKVLRNTNLFNYISIFWTRSIIKNVLCTNFPGNDVIFVNKIRIYLWNWHYFLHKRILIIINFKLNALIIMNKTKYYFANDFLMNAFSKISRHIVMLIPFIQIFNFVFHVKKFAYFH